MKKVLYVLLPQFAEHELPYLTQPLRSDAMAMKENPKYENKIVAESMEPIEAISGFRILRNTSCLISPRHCGQMPWQ